MVILLSGIFNKSYSQRLRFKPIITHTSGSGPILNVAQDKNGYLWYNQIGSGIFRFDGIEEKNFQAEDSNVNSMSGNAATNVIVDRKNRIWISYQGKGVDMYDQEKKLFTHYRRDSNSTNSLSSDTVFALLEDRSGNIWIGGFKGIDKLNPETGLFTHFIHDPADPGSLSYNLISLIYQARDGTIWVGCNHPFLGKPDDNAGGLNRLDSATGKFKRYMHDSADEQSLVSSMVTAIFEDSKGNFWVGTTGDGLQKLDRKTGKVQRYPFHPAVPDQLSRGPVNYEATFDHVTFIDEDTLGNLWIGNFHGGLQRYDPVNQKMYHYGRTRDKYGSYSTDSSTGLTAFTLYRMMKTKNGEIFVTSPDRKIFRLEKPKPSIPFIDLNGLDGNAFYADKKRNVLWVATSAGLMKKNLATNEVQFLKHSAADPNSIASDTIGSLRVDANGIFWMGTNAGLCRFDPEQNRISNYILPEVDNSVNSIFLDSSGVIFVGYQNIGVQVFDPVKQSFVKSYRFNKEKGKGLINDRVYGVVKDIGNNYWIVTHFGVNRVDTAGKFFYYLEGHPGRAIFRDSDDNLWVGTQDGLYRYDREKDKFLGFVDPIIRKDLGYVLHIMEDAKNQLWISAGDAIYRINHTRDTVTKYGNSYGIRPSGFDYGDNHIGFDGKIYVGDVKGYYAFYPEALQEIDTRPLLSVTSININNDKNSKQSAELNKLLWSDQAISLSHSQNSFSFEFNAFDYESPGDENYMYILENYDNEWRYVAKERRAYFFNVPPGKYVFRVRALNAQDQWVEKSISIVITPPWWKTWWAYMLGILIFAGLIWWFINLRSKQLKHDNFVLEEKVRSRTEELNKSLNELQATQNQLVQREKMASLGELTAGIAHEIQNPLNFVNNFSEVNKELLQELNEEIEKGNLEEVKLIAKDVISNEEKIVEHGKRADAIVKSMLQHSRVSAGQKEATDINALADEYLRLSYHGLRAKDKNFNAALKTDFDPTIGNVFVVAQDFGRVLLNMYNNAFYAVNEKSKSIGAGFEPVVSVSTKKVRQGIGSGRITILISISDNGNGIPSQVRDKIFQPFFTTKPTGSGTGLGLSLSYDIIKAHGGELNVDSTPGEGASFIISLPA